MQVRWSLPAAEDLERICERIERDNPEAARRFCPKRCAELALVPARAPSMRYDGDIMMARTQIMLEHEIQRRARQRASDLGVSLAEYIRRFVARDLGGCG